MFSVIEYEDTVRPEIEPCDQCQQSVDDLDAHFWGYLRLCKSCDADLTEQCREDLATLEPGP